MQLPAAPAAFRIDENLPMNALTAPASPATYTTRSQRLSQITRAPHETLDALVKAKAAFHSLQGFGRFLSAQYLFQAELAPFYSDDRLTALFPGLPQRCRADQALADLADLGLGAPAAMPGAPVELNVAEALGWIFVSEGSKLGAAFLYKRAQALGLSADKGARHLAEPDGGRAAGWKAFVKSLDALSLSEAEERLADAGALAAFARFTLLLQAAYADAQA
jgi:heme oxygenase (biliverdin-IX-beta and delta-forming)